MNFFAIRVSVNGDRGYMGNFQRFFLSIFALILDKLKQI